MTAYLTLMLSALLLGAPLGQAEPQEPPQPDRQVDQNRGPDRNRDRDRGDREQGRRRFRERRDAYMQATPEQRREMRLDRWVQMTSRTYDLNDSQQEVVRNEIKTMADERRQQMGPTADEYDRLRDQMFERWAKAAETGGEGEGRRDRRRRMQDDPEMQKLRERMNEIESAYPLDMEAAVQRIEKLLPEDQVRKGRERRQEWEQRRQQFREERGRDGERRRDRRDRGGRDRSPVTEAGNKAEAELRAAKEAAEAEQQSLAAAQAAEAEAAVAARAAKELHPWERYVREFVASHKLNESQETAAMAILKDARQRAAQIEQTQEKRRAEAEKLPDKAAREAALKELSKPIDDLFEEIKQRLDGLLTATQRGDRTA